ncbi:ribonuclease 3 [Ditylenchus destructor]|nr:ribonuclease 3 [Ditylenchus destructor]
MINEESLDKISSDENSDTELTGDQCQAVKNNQRLFEYSLPTISNTRDCYQKPNITQKPIISRSPSSLFVNCYSKMANEVEIGTEKLQLIHSNFKRRVLEKIRSIREIQPVLEIRKEPQFHACSSCQEDYNDDSSSSNDSSSSSDDDCEDHKPIDITRQTNLTEIDRKRSHPCALHPDISFNEAGQVNDGPYCKCSWAAKQTGVRHNKFAGEKPFKVCDLNSNNIDHLYHYVLKIRPCPAEFSRQPSQLCIGGVKEPYIFEGFSVFFHRPLPDGFRKTPINKWNPEFEIELVDEKVPKGFTVGDLELFYTYLFENVLELYDLDRTLNASDELSCVYWHAMPRFVRRMPSSYY